MNGIISSCYIEDCKEILRKKSITHQSPLSFYNSNFASCGAQRSTIIVKSKTFWVVCRLIKSTFTNHHGFYDRQDIAPLDMWWNSPTNFTSSCDTCMQSRATWPVKRSKCKSFGDEVTRSPKLMPQNLPENCCLSTNKI